MPVPAPLVILTDDRDNVVSITLRGEALPLQDMLSFSVTHDPRDMTKVTFTFYAKVTIREQDTLLPDT
jgi:hypothetical protein